MTSVCALRVVAPLLVGVGATVALVGPADAQSGRCAPGTGVTVVVDYGPLGGGAQVGCDPGGAGKPASQVVPAAGFSLTYVNGEPFVCRIDNKPGSSTEGCQRTPPTDAYWGLFWSDGKSSTWSYSSTGVGGLSVPKGGSIGWRFQDGGARENPTPPPTRTPQGPSPSPSPSPSKHPHPSPHPSSQPSRPPKATPSAAPQPSRTPTPRASMPPASSSPPSGGAATPHPPRSSGPAAAAPSHGGNGGGHGKTGDGKPPPGHAGKGKHPAGSPTPGRRVSASADTASTTASSSGQKILTAVAASSVVLLGAAVGVAGWRRRS